MLSFDTIIDKGIADQVLDKHIVGLSIAIDTGSQFMFIKTINPAQSEPLTFLMAEGTERRKVVVVGDSETGKTSLLFRVSNKDKELPQFPPTIMENQVIK